MKLAGIKAASQHQNGGGRTAHRRESIKMTNECGPSRPAGHARLQCRNFAGGLSAPQAADEAFAGPINNYVAARRASAHKAKPTKEAANGTHEVHQIAKQ